MKLKTFKKYLGTFGTDFARWPETGGQDFMEESEKARDLYGQAAKLEQALDMFTAPGLDKDLVEELDLTRQPAAPQVERLPQKKNSWLFPVAGAAVAAAMILYAGMSPAPSLSVDPVEQVASVDTMVEELVEEQTSVEQELAVLDEMLIQLTQVTTEPVPQSTPQEDEIDRFIEELDETELPEDGIWAYFMNDNG